MKNETRFDAMIFVVFNDNEIEEMTWGEYLSEYFSDETTSPRGVEPRLHIREFKVPYDMSIEDEFDEFHDLNDEVRLKAISPSEDSEIKTVTFFNLCEWKVNGDYTIVERFNTEAEAEEELLEYWENLYHNKDWDCPTHFYTKDEAEDFIKENF